MWKALGGLVSFAGAWAWFLVHKTVDAWFFEHVVKHTMKPLEAYIFTYGPALAMLGLAVWLWWPQIVARVPRLAHKSRAVPTPASNVLRDATQVPGPHVPLYKVIEFVATMLDDSGADGCFARTRSVIRQAAAGGRLPMRGRRQVAAFRFSTLETEIPPEYWARFEISPLSTEKGHSDDYHTTPETGDIHASPDKYTDLRADMDVAVKMWGP